MQTFTWLFEHLPLPLIGKQAAYDMDSFPVKLISFLYWVISCAIAVVPLIGWNDRWGYFHVGQVCWRWSVARQMVMSFYI